MALVEGHEQVAQLLVEQRRSDRGQPLRAGQQLGVDDRDDLVDDGLRERVARVRRSRTRA